MFTVDDLVASTQGELLQGARQKRIKSIGIDTRTIKKDQAFLAVRGSRFDGHAFIPEAVARGAACLIIEAAAARSLRNRSSCGAAVILVKDTLAALGDIARFHRDRFSIPVIAVTGSNGKTTTKEMIASVLGVSGRVLKTEGTKNNQIGVPLTLLGLRPRHTHAVVELGSNHPGEIACLARIVRPTMGVLTTIGPSHLEFFGDLDGVFQEKYSLRNHLRSPAVMVLNADDPMLKKKLSRPQRSPFFVSYGIHSPADFAVTHSERRAGSCAFWVNGRHRLHLAVLGAHNLSNAMAAVAVGRLLGISYTGIDRGLRRVSLPEKRLALRYRKKVLFIDDSYNSNPLSLRTALEALEQMPAAGRKIVVMGDMLELGQAAELFHREAGEALSRVCDAFITVGELSRFSADTARSCGFCAQQVHVCDSAPEAREVLFNRICPRSGDIVLIKGSRSLALERILEATEG